MGQPPTTIKDFDTDSVMAEKANPAQPQKVVEDQVPPTITYSDSTHRMQTAQFPPKDFKRSQKHPNKPKKNKHGAQMIGAKMVGGQVTIVGAHQFQCTGDQTCQKHKRKDATKGEITTSVVNPKG